MKMLWLGVLMLASFLLSFTGFIEADENIPLDEDEPRDLDKIDLELPPPIFHKIPAHVSYDENDLLHDIGSDAEAEHIGTKVEALKPTRLDVEEAEKDLPDISQETILKHNQNWDVELAEKKINLGHIGSLNHYMTDARDDDDVIVDTIAHNLHNGVREDVMAHLIQGAEKADDVKDVLYEHVIHHGEDNDEVAHLTLVAENNVDVKDGLYEHVINHDSDNEEEDEVKMEELDDDAIVEAEYVGRFIHGDSNDEVPNADDTKGGGKRPSVRGVDETIEDEALKMVGMLRRSDRGEVGKGDKPNRTTRVYLKHVQDHLRLEEAHAVFEEGSEYIEKVVYLKPELPVVHKHKGNVKFVKHDEF